jgi:two-component system nitrogen regulation sensor histidine kinase NtrY
MLGTRSFRQRIFLATLLVALLPAALAVSVATLVVRELGSTVGTLGPWDAVAVSGRELIEVARAADPTDSLVLRVAEAHGDALSQSLRWSRLWTVVNDRFLALLPWMALLTASSVALLAFFTARWFSRGFSGPVQELVDWTGRIARGEPLPPPSDRGSGEVIEFATLRSSLRTMAEALDEARHREIESVRLKAWTEMARRVAHELKNPLTPMRLAATTIARDNEPGRAQTGQLLLEEIDRLDEMARTFSQFGRLPEGPVSEVDLPELLQSVARQHSEGGATVEIRAGEGLLTVPGHYDVLYRAFRNLIVNALEAVDAHPQAPGDGDDGPAVRLTVDRVTGGVRTRVRDRGPGIPKEILGTLWDPDVTTKRSGTGLGLAIVRQAVDAHGGTVDARNLSGGAGAEIEVVLPVIRDGGRPWIS